MSCRLLKGVFSDPYGIRHPIGLNGFYSLCTKDALKLQWVRDILLPAPAPVEKPLKTLQFTRLSAVFSFLLKIYECKKVQKNTFKWLHPRDMRQALLSCTVESKPKLCFVEA